MIAHILCVLMYTCACVHVFVCRVFTGSTGPDQAAGGHQTAGGPETDEGTLVTLTNTTQIILTHIHVQVLP